MEEFGSNQSSINQSPLLQAAYCLCNLASQGAMFTQELIELGALQAIIPMLKSSDPEAISLGLAFTEMALRSTDNVSTCSSIGYTHLL